MKRGGYGLAFFGIKEEPMGICRFEDALNDGVERDLLSFVGLGVAAG